MSILSRFLASVLVAGLLLSFTQSARADETIRKAQARLHEQGFYYGSIDGVSGDETTQAIRRYQIRNGLAITGQLNDETLRSLQLGGSAGSSSGSTPRAGSTPPARTPPPVISGRSDREPAPSREPTPPPLAPSPARPPVAATPPAPSTRYSRPDLRAAPPLITEEAPGRAPASPPNAVSPSIPLQQFFNGTPFEFAPPPVQADTVRRIQSTLRRAGFYDGSIDGAPGPQTSAAITEFQGANGLRRTGRIDFPTFRLLQRVPDEVPRRQARPQPFFRGDSDDSDEDDLRRYRRYRPRRGGSGVYEGRIVD